MKLGETTCENCTYRVGRQCLRNPPTCARVGGNNEYPTVKTQAEYQLACSQFQQCLKQEK